MSYVYLITSASAVKIGIADDPHKRLSQLQTGHHDTLQLYCTFHCADKSKASRLEKFLHNRYKTNRLKGEWFHVNPERVIMDVISDKALKTLTTGHQIHEIWMRDMFLAAITVEEKPIQDTMPDTSALDQRVEELLVAIALVVTLIMVALFIVSAGVSMPLHYVVLLAGFGFGLLFVFAIVLSGTIYHKLK